MRIKEDEMNISTKPRMSLSIKLKIDPEMGELKSQILILQNEIKRLITRKLNKCFIWSKLGHFAKTCRFEK